MSRPAQPHVPPRDDPRRAAGAGAIMLAFQSDRFFTTENLLNQGRLMAEVGLVALAMTFVIVTGGIDLSVGSILGLVAILLGVFWQNVGLPLPVAMVLASLPAERCRFRQRPHHHPLRGAALDRHAGHARALSRACRRHQPGALGARLSRMVLRSWARANSSACRCNSGSSASAPSSPPSSSA